jgi:hypothetical protein
MLLILTAYQWLGKHVLAFAAQSMAIFGIVMMRRMQKAMDAGFLAYRQAGAQSQPARAALWIE